MNRILLLAFLIILFSGCVANSDTPPTDSSSTTSSAGEDGQDGARGRDGSASPPVQDNVTRREILSQDFELNSLQPTGPIAVQVPEGATRILMALDYETGAYQDASFTLGACRNVTPVQGTAVSVMETSILVGGSISRGLEYDCGALPAGTHEITWKLTGALHGHVTVLADVA